MEGEENKWKTGNEELPFNGRHPAVSIIIPVYNVKPYLKACLDSLLAQSFVNWEAICVDDGSTDGSGAVLDRYAVEDGRFRIIHQANRGVSVARNEGLKYACGTYVMMVDSDDWIETDTVGSMVGMMEETGAELGMCGRFHHEPSGEVLKILPGACFLRTAHGKDYSIQELRPGLRKEIPPYACTKIFRSSLIDELELSFLPGVKIGEDMEFMMHYLSCCTHIAYINKPLYHYRRCVGITDTLAVGKVSAEDVTDLAPVMRSLCTLSAGACLSGDQKRGFYLMLLQSVLDHCSCVRYLASFLPPSSSSSAGFPWRVIIGLLFRVPPAEGMRLIVKFWFPGFTGFIRKFFPIR